MCENDLRNVVQIGIVVDNIERAAESWSKLLGVEPPKIVETGPWEETKMEFRGSPSGGRAKLAFIKLENIVIELIEPIGGPSTWREFLEKHGPGIHHIAFDVDKPEECLKKLEDLGARIEQRGQFRGGYYIYIDARKSLGAIVEILHHYRENR